MESGAHGTDETVSLLHVSPSQADIEISKRDTREPYFVVALGELKWMASSSFLTSLTLLLESAVLFINVVSVGHLGAAELGAMTFSTTCFATIALAPAFGIMGAMQTFCSNAYTASSDKTMVGFHLQRGIIAAFYYLVFAVPILLKGEQLLLAIGLKPEIAHLSGQYLQIQTLGVAPLILFEACKCFLQSQEIMSGGFIVISIVVPIHAISSYLLVHSSYGIGFKGAAISTVIAYWLMFFGILIYIRYSRAVETWGGWNYKAFYNMSEFYRLAVPAAIAVSAELFSFELINIGSSYFNTNQLAATAIVVNSSIVAYQISNGLGYSTAPRIGNLIGAGKPRQACIARDMGILAAGLAGTFCLLFLTFCGGWWISVYTNDVEVIKELQIIMPIFCAFVIFDALNILLTSIVRGLGRQKLSAWCYLFNYYFVAVPLGLYLGFVRNMESAGLWWSICVAIILSTSMQFVYAYLWMDWKDEVRLCLLRLKRSTEETNEAQNSDEQ
ncbi:MATE efflux family protein [Coemansia reversa NRRL 1564]|uniref:MATE efflux family protein n=1 Tax=Coemansia reversa (strain ATCC 12441 / NRRL 1564) TaxID=763665 RepID=A0A2G5BL89_COERN|nr:MATE efflux family protein [Coemansia reversa NRRL 1564]|eukprot:PIA19785.1 MATE efflux family protein [Coemansia reversa NRRL 1564]